ncbi:MAG: NAD-dependent epimerase/dehydratase family protein [Ramlibacter sp.]
MKVLVTGGTGNVGVALLRCLAKEPGMQLRAAVRAAPASPVPSCEYVMIGDLGAGADLTGIAQGCDVVVHTAARVHMMEEDAATSATAYTGTNVAGTLRVAEEAARARVRRFIFISTVKVHGESTQACEPFREENSPAPQGPYAVSKLEAEAGLRVLCAKAGMEFVIVRPPLVYGPGVGANFLALAQAVQRRLPLPLGAVHNHRSLVGIDNLVSFLRLCMDHPAAANEVFLVSDGRDLSSPDLVRGLAKAMGRPARLLPAPGWLLRGVGALTGRGLAVQRLLDNLQVDIAKARTLLSWTPPVSVEEGLRRAVQDLVA